MVVTSAIDSQITAIRAVEIREDVHKRTGRGGRGTRAAPAPFRAAVAVTDVRRDKGESVASAAGVAAAAELVVEGVVVDGPSLAGEGVDELDRLGLLVGGDVGPAVLDDVVGRGCLAVAEDDDGLHALGPLWI